VARLHLSRLDAVDAGCVPHDGGHVAAGVNPMTRALGVWVLMGVLFSVTLPSPCLGRSSFRVTLPSPCLWGMPVAGMPRRQRGQASTGRLGVFAGGIWVVERCALAGGWYRCSGWSGGHVREGDEDVGEGTVSLSAVLCGERAGDLDLRGRCRFLI